MLVRKELLSPEWAERILSWPHTGFNVHSLVRAKTKPEAERVGKYMIRPVLALERLTFLEPEGKVGYRWGRDGAEQETEVMDYLEFIARVTSHIPDKGQVMVRYYGLYANAHIHGASEADVRGGEAPAVPCFRAGCARGGRGERGILLIIRAHGERKSIVFHPVRRRFLSGYDLWERFSRLLTWPPGQRYSPAMDRSVNSAPRAGIQFARKKQIIIILIVGHITRQSRRTPLFIAALF